MNSQKKGDLPKENYKPDKNLRKIKNPEAYELRMIQILIRLLNRRILHDPTCVKWADYVELLEKHTQKVIALKKKGWTNDQEEVESEVHEESAKGTSEKARFGLDSDVFA